MATNFPTALDTFTDPLPTDQTTTVDHSLNHGSANDAIHSVQVKVGINSSADTNSLDYKVSTNTATITGHISQTAAHGATGAVVGTTNAQVLTNKTIDFSANSITNIPEASVVGLVADLAAKQTGSTRLTGLTAMANTVGIVAYTNTDTFTPRSIAVGSSRLTISNGAGTAGNPTIDAVDPPYASIASDQTVTSSVTVVNATSMVLTLLANRTYIVRANLGFTGAAAGDARTVWAVTSTVAAITGNTRLCIGPSINTTDATGTAAAATTVGVVRTSRTTIATEVTYGTDGTAESAVYEEFTVVGGASGGTLQLKFAQGTSSVTATALKAGSYVSATVVG